MTDIEILEAVSSLVSDNEEYRKLWVEEHKNKEIVSKAQKRVCNMEKVEYLVIQVFSAIYVVEGEMTVLGASLFKEHIHVIFPCDSLKGVLNCLSWNICSFPSYAYVVMKKGEDGIFREIDYKKGYEVNGKFTEFNGEGLILPIEKNGKIWVEIEGFKDGHKLSKEYMDLFNGKKKKIKGGFPNEENS